MEQEKINRLQWILDDAVAGGEIPGAILMVRREGKEIVYLESGYADIEAKKPVSRDSIYRLYSMSKPITATAVMILVERGLIWQIRYVDIFLDFVDKWWQQQTAMWKSHGGMSRSRIW